MPSLVHNLMIACLIGHKVMIPVAVSHVGQFHVDHSDLFASLLEDKAVVIKVLNMRPAEHQIAGVAHLHLKGLPVPVLDAEPVVNGSLLSYIGNAFGLQDCVVIRPDLNVTPGGVRNDVAVDFAFVNVNYDLLGHLFLYCFLEKFAV